MKVFILNEYTSLAQTYPVRKKTSFYNCFSNVFVNFEQVFAYKHHLKNELPRRSVKILSPYVLLCIVLGRNKFVNDYGMNEHFKVNWDAPHKILIYDHFLFLSFSDGITIKIF